MAFETLKTALVSSPILAMPTDDDIYVLDTDASDHSIGAVVSQIQSGEERVIACESRTYSKAERNYCTTRTQGTASGRAFHETVQTVLVRQGVLSSNRPRSSHVVTTNTGDDGAAGPLAGTPTGV